MSAATMQSPVSSSKSCVTSSKLGYSVLLSDVDIVTLRNPFNHLYRDSDIEAMSDGWDNATAYGEQGLLQLLRQQSLRLR